MFDKEKFKEFMDSELGDEVSSEIWEQIEFSNDRWLHSCWSWRVGFSGDYASFHGKPVHRYLYNNLRYEIMPKHKAHHMCRNKWCINPYHITEVTNQEHARIHRSRANRKQEEQQETHG